MKAYSNDRIIFRAMWLAVMLSSFAVGSLLAQDEMMEEKPEPKPVKNTFESIWLIDAQTVMVPIKGTFEVDFQHRFGTWEKGYDEFYGIFASSNIRLGAEYVPVDRLLVGIGFTKFNNLFDFFGKYAILKQMKNGGSPVSLTYYMHGAIDTRKDVDDPALAYAPNFTEFTDRMSFFHQVMVARKITDKLSLQLSGNLSWFNRTEVFGSDGEYLGVDQNAHFSASAIARYKFSNSLGVIVAYDQPIKGNNELVTREANLSFGLEVVTSAHAFQIFIGNYQSLIPQYNHTYNTNSWSGRETDAQGNEGNHNGILIGFNLTRLWNF